jgi:hypothetical protein
MNWHRRSTNERGQGLLEFAVIFPVFMIVLFVIIDAALVMGETNGTNNAAKEAARFGAVQTGDWDDIRDDIVDLVESQTKLDTSGGSAACNGIVPEVCVEWIDGPDDQDGGEVGSYIRVILKYEYDPVTPLFSFLPGGTIDPNWVIETCAIQRVERPVDDSPEPPETNGDCE